MSEKIHTAGGRLRLAQQGTLPTWLEHLLLWLTFMVTPAQLVTAVFLTCQGLIWLAPGDTFATSPVSYETLIDLCPRDWVWGAGVLALAVFLWISVIGSPRLSWHRVALQVTCLWHACLSGFFLLANPSGVAWTAYGCFSLLAFWAWWEQVRAST